MKDPVKNIPFLAPTILCAKRVTIMSTIALVDHLLKKEKYGFVLTGKFNQDCVEVGFIVFISHCMKAINGLRFPVYRDSLESCGLPVVDKIIRQWQHSNYCLGCFACIIL